MRTVAFGYARRGTRRRGSLTHGAVIGCLVVSIIGTPSARALRRGSVSTPPIYLAKPRSGDLIFARAQRSDLYRVPAAGGRAHTIRLPNGLVPDSLAASWNGALVAFDASGRGLRPEEIFTIDTQGLFPLQITSDRAGNFDPA